MNLVVLKGNLTKDVELRTTINNKSVARFVLAVNDGYGEKQVTSYINCEVWNKLAENLANYCGKGSRLLLKGNLRTETYDGQDGQKKYVTKVIAESIEFLDKKKDSVETQSDTQSTIRDTQDPYQDFGEEIALSDDDLPF